MEGMIKYFYFFYSSKMRAQKNPSVVSEGIIYGWVSKYGK